MTNWKMLFRPSFQTGKEVGTNGQRWCTIDCYIENQYGTIGARLQSSISNVWLHTKWWWKATGLWKKWVLKFLHSQLPTTKQFSIAVIFRICSHSAAYKYFIESLKRHEFFSIKCKDFDRVKTEACIFHGASAIFMGENFNAATPHGFYYFKTNSKSPFGMGVSPFRNLLFNPWHRTN